MFEADNTEQLDERMAALAAYSNDINDLETRAAALKELRDVVIAGLVGSGVPTRTIADAVGLSHVRVAAIANQANSAA